ncbi:MAG: efflux RND transporter periplasmic adaptor subunit [Nitrospirae bacterium]|nr:MAG: efflux RND transporter periplasmic adaptor subunit [Nitrospirota bacterium]
MKQPRTFQRLVRICSVFLAALSVVALSLGSPTGCAKDNDEATGSKPAAATARAGVVRLAPEAVAAAGIEVSPVARGLFRFHRDFPATVQPNKNKLAEVTTLVRGRAVDVYVDVGKDVKAGALLARLYSSDLGLAQASYLKTSAKLHEAELAFERAKGLLEDKAISLAELQKREAEAKSARAEAREARNRLEVLGMHEPDIQRLDREHTISSYVPISAPFAGRVIARNLAKGEVAETHHELFTVADLSDLWVVANIPEKDVRFIHRDQSVEVLVAAYPNEVFQGAITYIGDVLDAATRTMKLRVVVPNRDARLKPEMFATLRVYINTVTGVLTVPSAAVQRDQNRAVVFVQVEPGTFEARSVTLGDESGEVVKVLEGLREGEPVVTRGAFALKSEAEKHKIEPTR